MADAYWRYGGEGLQQQPPPQGAKRPRSDLELPSGRDMSSYFPGEDDRGGQRSVRDIDSINASYERYLRSTQMPSLGGDSGPGRSLTSGLGGLYPDDTRGILGRSDLAVAPKVSPVRVGGRPEIQLPPDATSTLFVEGLPANCTRREVSHIFRPFLGYREVRLVTKDSRHTGGDPMVLCFVDFLSPAHAATAMDALRGYTFDELDRDASPLRIQFARNPGARSGGAHRGGRR